MTSADDNKILVFNFLKRYKVDDGVIDEKRGPARKSGYGASTLSHLPPNQQSRALAFSSKLDHLAVCTNDGGVTVRSSKNWSQALHTLGGPK